MKAVTSLGPLLEAVQSALVLSLRSCRPASVNEIGFANLQGGLRIRVKFSEVIERSRMSDDESVSGYTATRGATSCYGGSMSYRYREPTEVGRETGESK